MLYGGILMITGEQIERMVDFEKWCPKCKHNDIAENTIPCAYCMETSIRDYTDKPEKFEEKKGR